MYTQMLIHSRTLNKILKNARKKIMCITRRNGFLKFSRAWAEAKTLIAT